MKHNRTRVGEKLELANAGAYNMQFSSRLKGRKETRSTCRYPKRLDLAKYRAESNMQSVFVYHTLATCEI